MKDYFVSKISFTYEQHNFLSRDQKEKIAVEYVAELQKLAKTCDFKELTT